MSKSTITVILILIYILFYSAFIEPNKIMLEKYTIKDSYLDGIKVIYLSDFRLKSNETKRLSKIIRATVEQNPDIILLGGDYTKGSFKKGNIIRYLARKLNSTSAKVYAVLGENDNQNSQKIKTILVNNGITVLEDQNARTLIRGKYFDIIGINDITTNPDISKAFNKTMNQRIVFMHNPDIYYSIVDDTNMIFAGHTHGGQFNLPFTPPLFVPSKFGSQFAGGLTKENRNVMIISRGLGTWNIPLRLLCKPEIVMVEFVKENENGLYSILEEIDVTNKTSKFMNKKVEKTSNLKNKNKKR